MLQSSGLSGHNPQDYRVTILRIVRAQSVRLSGRNLYDCRATICTVVKAQSVRLSGHNLYDCQVAICTIVFRHSGRRLQVSGGSAERRCRERQRNFFGETLSPYHYFAYLCTDQASTSRQGGSRLIGILRPGTPFVRTAKGERTFSDVTVCAIKSRKFESCHGGNATGASAWVSYIPTDLLPYIIYYGIANAPTCIISLGVGWLALLILDTGQCESLIAGISTEE